MMTESSEIPTHEVLHFAVVKVKLFLLTQHHVFVVDWQFERVKVSENQVAQPLDIDHRDPPVLRLLILFAFSPASTLTEWI